MVFLNLGRLEGMKRHAQVVLIGRKSMFEAFSLKQRTYSVSVPKKNGKLKDVLKRNDIFTQQMRMTHRSISTPNSANNLFMI